MAYVYSICLKLFFQKVFIYLVFFIHTMLESDLHHKVVPQLNHLSSTRSRFYSYNYVHPSLANSNKSWQQTGRVCLFIEPCPLREELAHAAQNWKYTAIVVFLNPLKCPLLARHVSSSFHKKTEHVGHHWMSTSDATELQSQ